MGAKLSSYVGSGTSGSRRKVSFGDETLQESWLGMDRQESPSKRPSLQMERQTSKMERQTTNDKSRPERMLASLVAGTVSFMLVTIMSVNFSMLVFDPVAGAVPSAVQMAIVGIGIVGNGALCCLARLPCVVVTADNGVVAPIVAQMVVAMSMEIEDPEALKATSVAAVALACLCFGGAQLMLVRLQLTKLVKLLPYSIPMGFLSGIGLELCGAISLAGCAPSQVVAVLLAVTLCLGSWWRGWPLSVLFPVLLAFSITVFYCAGKPNHEDWLLEFKGHEVNSGAAWMWSRDIWSAVRWDVLLRLGPTPFGTLFMLGSFQNILFAEVFARTPGLKHDIDPDQVLAEFGKAFLSGGVCGFTGGFHNMACFSLSRELKSYSRAPSGLVALLSCGLWYVGLDPILKVPRFVFSGLLIWVGLKFLRTYLWQPARMLPRSETAVIISVALIMKFNGFATGVFAGLVLALVGMVGELATLSCVQVVSSGHEARSNAVRSARAEQLLLTLGHSVLVLRMAPGFVFFATSAELLKIVERRLGEKIEPWQVHDAWVPGSDSSESEDDGLGEMEALSLSKVVLDFTLCRGFDGSLVGVLQQLAALGLRKNFRLCLAGLKPKQQKWIKSNLPGARPTVYFFVDLDRALESVEDELLASQGFTFAKDARRPSVMSSKVAQRLTSDEMAMQSLKGGSNSNDWALLFLYSDTSATSRGARPAVAQAMAVINRRCELFEASEEACPKLTQRFGHGPVLVLFRRGEPSLILGSEEMNTGSNAGATGVAMSPVAKAIKQKIEAKMNEVDSSLKIQPGTEARKSTKDLALEMHDALGIQVQSPAQSPSGSPPQSPFPEFPASGKGGGTPVAASVTEPVDSEFTPRHTKSEGASLAEDTPRHTKSDSAVIKRRPKAMGGQLQRRNSIGADRDILDVSMLWVQFLQLAGMPKNSILQGLPRLPEVLTGPRVLPKGEVLFHKGSAQAGIYFVVNGLLSLWNEGRGHDQSEEQTGLFRRQSTAQHRVDHSKISKGTSRLLRVGPGWTLGGNFCHDLGLRESLHTLSCIAETDSRVLELRAEKMQELWKTEPGLVVAVQGLVMHFNSQLFHHTASLLSDMHTLVFAEPLPLWKSESAVVKSPPESPPTSP